MEKKLFNGFLLVAVCFGSLGIQKNLTSSNSSLSGLMLENVEALTTPEVAIKCGLKEGNCWKKGVTITFCPDSTMNYKCELTGRVQDYCINPC